MIKDSIPLRWVGNRLSFFKVQERKIQIRTKINEIEDKYKIGTITYPMVHSLKTLIKLIKH